MLTHPSFALASFSRCSGGNPNLFGSNISHNEFIELKITHAQEHRGLNTDHRHGTDTILNCRMSLTQFAELVSTQNSGEGIPVTLSFTEKDGYVPQIKVAVDKSLQFRNEFSGNIRKAMSDIMEQIDAVQSSLNGKKPLGVKEREEIIRRLERAKAGISGNLDFCAEQFAEFMEGTVTDAKGEVEAFIGGRMQKIAEKAIAENAGRITESAPVVSIPEFVPDAGREDRSEQ